MNLVLLGIALLVLVIIWYVTKFRTNLSPMPYVKGAWPLIGNAYQLDRQRPDRSFIQWARELGPVYSVRILHKTWVVVSGYDELQEMLVTKVTTSHIALQPLPQLLLVRMRQCTLYFTMVIVPTSFRDLISEGETDSASNKPC